MFTEKDFWDYFSEETIIIDLISTQKPEEPNLGTFSLKIR
jgi:hypothetical protein